MNPSQVFELYRSAIEEISNFPPPARLDLQHTPQAYFSDHTPEHLRRAQVYAEELIKKSNLELNCCETFLLLMGIWTHDIGMFFKLDPNESDDNARSEHHERVVQILSRVEAAWHLPALSPGITPLLAIITRAHRRAVSISAVISSSTVDQHPIRVNLLAAILRISDASDIDRRRAPEAIFELYEQAIPESSKRYWLGHQIVAGVSYDVVSSSIWVNILPSTGDLGSVITHLELCRWLREELRDELRSVQSVFRDYNVRLYHVELIDHPSGRIIELERPPNEAPCLTISLRQNNLTAANIDTLERVIREHPGAYKVAVEVRTTSGSLYATVSGLSADGEHGTIAAIIDALGDATSGCELQSTQPVDGWRMD